MEIHIETDRLIIRKIDISDLKGMYKLDSDPEVHRYLGGNYITDEASAAKCIELIEQRYIDNGIARWAVINKETSEFIGWTGFEYITKPINNQLGYLDVGYRFIKEAWGKGYATESGKACMEYAKKYLNQYKLHAISDVDNTESRKVLEKLGFEVIETFKFEEKPHYWYNLKNE